MTIRNDDSVRWSELCQFSIDVSSDGTDWNSGRTQDVLTILNTTIVATTGGVWLIDASGDAWPVSDKWPAMAVMSLCKSSLQIDHVFACSAAPIQLYETDLTQAKPLFQWKAVPLPSVAMRGLVGGPATHRQIDTVYSAATTRAAPLRVVIATDIGVFWSPLGAPGGYSWTQALWINPRNVAVPFERTSTGVAIGAADSVLVAPLDTIDELFRGEWDSQGRLILRSVTLPPHNQPLLKNELNWLTVASCDSVASNAYVLAFDNGGRVVGVLRSVTDGKSWTWCSFTVDTGESLNEAGGDATSGGRVKHIAVDPHDPEKVSIAGIQGFISLKGGNAPWHNIQCPHSDVHRVYFDPLDSSGDTLLCASDGGVFISKDGGKNWDSSFNKNLRTLQCYSPGLVRSFWGCMDVYESPQTGAWVATGLQDNHNVMLSLNLGPQARWKPFGDGDGGYCRFLPSGAIVYSGVGEKDKAGNVGGNIARVASAGTNWEGNDIPDAAVYLPEQRTGIKGPRLYTFKRAWRGPFPLDSALYGVATNDDERGAIFGLFGRISTGEVTHWARLCQLPIEIPQDTITAFGEHAQVLWAATARGRLFSFGWTGNYPLAVTSAVVRGFFVPNLPTIYELPSVLPTSLPQLGFVGLSVVGIEVWAIVAREDPGRKGQFQSRIFQLLSTSWTEMTLNLADPATDFAPRLQAIHFDGHNVFAAGDGAVYRLGPMQDEWFNVSTGLPTAFQGSDLAELHAAPASVLLLSTFNRGVWRMELPR